MDGPLFTRPILGAICLKNVDKTHPCEAIRFRAEEEDIEFIKDLWANVISLPSLQRIKHETRTMIVIKVMIIIELDAIKRVNLKEKKKFYHGLRVL